MHADMNRAGVDAQAIEATRARLSEMLKDPAQFRAFAADPQAFAAKNGLVVDATLLRTLKARLAGLGSYEEAQKVESPLPMLAISNPASANEKPLAPLGPQTASAGGPGRPVDPTQPPTKPAVPIKPN